MSNDPVSWLRAQSALAPSPPVGGEEQVAPPPTIPGYRVTELLGHGSSSRVWAALDPMGRDVALKVPAAGPAGRFAWAHRTGEATRATGGGPAADVRWASPDPERHILTAVEHPHLVRLRDVVQLPDGTQVLVMDRVHGMTLADLVDMRGHLRPGEVATLVVPVAEAVDAVHGAGAVHGDLSARNVMVEPIGRPVLMDLGSALVAATEPGEVAGTLGFVAPEVRAGDRPGAAADVYALGALIWLCATGNRAPQTLERLTEQTVVSHVGPELGPLVARALDPDPDVRPTPRQLACEVHDAAPAEPVEVPVAAAGSPRSRPDDAELLTRRIRPELLGATRGRPMPPVRLSGARARLSAARRRIGAGVLVLVLAFLAGAGAVRLLRSSAPDPAAPVSVLSTAAPTTTGSVTAGSVTAGSATAGPDTAVSAAAAPASTAPSPATTASTSTSAVPAPTATAPTSGEATPPSSEPVSDTPASRAPGSQLQAIADRRAEALTSLQTDALGAVHAQGSPSWQQDEQTLAAMRRDGLRFSGLHYTVSEARIVSTSGDAFVVRARVDTEGYALVGPTGTRAVPARPGQVLDFVLVPAGASEPGTAAAGWVLREISSPAAT